MQKIIVPLLLISLLMSCSSQSGNRDYNVSVSDIYLSDPFVFADNTDNTYYLYGTGGGGTVMARASKDLRNWTQRFIVYDFPEDHWAGENAPTWAAEVHEYQGQYYLFTTSDDGDSLGENILGDTYPHRASQIYVADSPTGPFRDFTDNTPHTPWEWPALDGTLWVEEGVPYMIFCHEWLQVLDGTMEAVRLPEDIGVPTSEPFTLFRASDAPWVEEKQPRIVYVTDGPFLFRTQTGRLGVLWSSWRDDMYVLMAAYSESGSLKGPWIQDEDLLFEDNGGHGMLFETFGGTQMLSMHYVDPNDEEPRRQPMFVEVDLSGDRLVLKEDGLMIR